MNLINIFSRNIQIVTSFLNTTENKPLLRSCLSPSKNKNILLYFYALETCVWWQCSNFYRPLSPGYWWSNLIWRMTYLKLTSSNCNNINRKISYTSLLYNKRAHNDLSLQNPKENNTC